VVDTAQSSVVLPVPVKERPHWRVLIMPDTFNRERLKSLPACWELIESCRISRGGRSYPYISRDPRYRQQGNDWVASWLDSWRGYQEYWKLYQSAQFIHLFSFVEDIDREETTRIATSRVMDLTNDFVPNGCLDISNAMRTITEVVEFTARLAQRDDFGETVSLTINMVDVRNRLLMRLSPRLTQTVKTQYAVR
jgi:hypothetical protein